MINNIKDLWYYVKILTREAYYLELKMKGTLNYYRLRSGIKRDYIGYLVLTFFTALIITIPIALDSLYGNILTVSISSFILAMVCFLITFIIISMKTWILQEYKLLDPLRLLPLTDNKISLIILFYTLFNALPMLLAPIIFTSIIATKYPNVLLILNILIYNYSAITLAIALSYRLASFLTKYSKTSGRVLRARISRFLSATIFIIAMLFFNLSYYLMGRLFVQIGKMTTLLKNASYLTLLWFIYPFSIFKCTNIDHLSLSESLLTNIVYLGLFTLFYFRSFNNFFKYYITPTVTVYKHKWIPIREPRHGMNYICAMILKDLKVAFREPRTASLIFLPLYSIIVILLTWSKFNPTVILIGILFMIGILCGSMLYQAIISEGKALWYSLFLLGRKKFLKGKTYFVTSICFLYSFIVALYYVITTGCINCFILALCSLATYLSITYITAKILEKRVYAGMRVVVKYNVADALITITLSIIIVSLVIAPYFILSLIFKYNRLMSSIISLLVALIILAISHKIFETISDEIV